MLSSIASPLTAQQVGERTLLLVWQGEPAPRPARTIVRIGGAPASGACAQIRLPLDARRSRNVLAVRADPRVPAGSIEIADRDGGTIARLDCEAESWRHALEFDAHVLTAGLPGRERARLVRFLIEVVRSLFRLGGDPVFAATLRTLLAETVEGAGRAAARCSLTAGLVLCETLVPDSLGPRPTAVVLTAEGYSRLPAEPGLLPVARTRSGQALLGLVLPAAAVAAGASILVFGEGGVVRRVLAAHPTALPAAHEWLAKSADGRPEHRRFILDRLSDRRVDGASCEALSRELQVLAPSGSARAARLDVAAELVLETCGDLLIVGRLDDPHDLVEAMEIERRGVTRTPSEYVRFAGRGAGFVARLEDPAGAGAPARLALRLRSGTRIDVGDGPAALAPADAMAALMAAVPLDRTEAALVSCLEPVLRSLAREVGAAAGIRDVVEIGKVGAQSKVSLLVPLCADGELLRCRMGVFAGDASLAGVELLHLVEHPAHAADARRMLVDLHAAYDVPSRLVVFDRQPPLARMMAAATDLATGAFVAVLGRYALPEAPGWLAALVSHLDRQAGCGIVGAQIVNPDHSLLSAGSEIVVGAAAEGGWALRPLLRGFPRDYPPATVPARVAALPAECFVLSRTLARELFADAGDLLGADGVAAVLCLGARARRHEVWRLPAPAIVTWRGRIGEPPRNPLMAELERRELARLFWTADTAPVPGQRAEAAPRVVEARRKAA